MKIFKLRKSKKLIRQDMIFVFTSNNQGFFPPIFIYDNYIKFEIVFSWP